ncbi:MAG TPA: fused MFS/spermidine synthase [Anaerolineales bacterium]|nr:fused MFS/spermidine synthase [Anaerolineales bacterium]
MRRTLLLIVVFIAGMTTLGVELTASRLLGNVYGTSNIVWANIIGLILVYLTAGYFLGGIWADRWPYPKPFYRLVLWASFTAGLVPIISRPVLLRAAMAVEHLETGLMLGSFLSILVLFSVPITLLGCISPYAIRLSIEGTDHAGRVSGKIYALSTMGSILGTFVPVLILIPTIGTARTFLVFSFTLMAVAYLGLGFHDRRQALIHLWMPIILAGLAFYTLGGPIKASSGQIFEAESSYNYIQVIERDGVRELLLNEGQGIHSVYAPDLTATYGTWDYFLVAPYFNPPGDDTEVKRLGLIGLAAGTISKLYSEVFGPVPIDGWEIDPEIIEVGRTLFDMTESNLNPIVADGRWGLTHSPYLYTVIGIDAYRLPYIPWHLTTREFFEEVRAHHEPNGVVVINIGRTPDDRRLIEAFSGTMGVVFPSVHVVDVPNTFNTIVFATVMETYPENLVANELALVSKETHPLLIDILHRTIQNLQPTPVSSMVFTDDLAPVEQITNSIALRFILGGSVESLR